MKCLVLILLFIPLLIPSAGAQDEFTGRRIVIGAFSSIGKNQPVRLTRKYVTEDVGPFHGQSSWDAGMMVSGMISQKMRLELGGGYAEHYGGFELTPQILPVSKVYYETITTTFINMNLYRYFVKNFYLNMGIICDFERPRESHWIDAQNGIGIGIGAGKEFRFRHFIIDISPRFDLHSVFAFDAVENQQRLAVFGIRLGMGPAFGNYRKKSETREPEVTLPTGKDKK